MATVRQTGQVGPKSPGQKQDAMPVNHTRSVKVPPTTNTRGGAHPAARRALGSKASSHAQQRVQAANMSTPGTPGAKADMNAQQDTGLNLANNADQDAMPAPGGAFGY